MGIWPKYAESCVFVENYACNNGFYGIEPEDSTNCIVYGNNVSSNLSFGLWLLECSDLCVTDNYVSGNGVGIGLTRSNSSNVYHNNFVANEYQALIEDSFGNSWERGGEGNFWDDYEGLDIDHDGIGDDAYVIGENDLDQHPLFGVFSDFTTDLGYVVSVVSNSSLGGFHYFDANGTIRMQLSTLEPDGFGFCRVTVPKGLISPPYTVMINNGLVETSLLNDAIFDNGTHRWIYFSFASLANEVSILPEFSSFAVLLVFGLLASLAAALLQRRLSAKNVFSL
jgi:parallel beta-helix repeat protein